MSQLSNRKLIQNTLQIIILFVTTLLVAQSGKMEEGLVKKSYNELDSLYYTEEYTELGKRYIDAYLEKAKFERNINEIIVGYHHLADFHDNEHELATAYIDSAITLNKKQKTKNRNRLALLYGKKGFIERTKGNFQIAIDYYLKELKLLDSIQNRFNIIYTKYNIGLIKLDYGDLKGAIEILKEHLRFDENRLKENTNNPEGYIESYLSTLHKLIRTYRLNKEIGQAKTLNRIGLNIGKGNKLEYFFIFNEGIFEYYDANLESGIQKIEAALPELKNSKNRYDFEVYNLVDAYFYLGKSYESIGNQEKKLQNFQLVDSITQASRYIIPETKLAYVGLVNHYKILGNSKKQLEYLDKLLYIDSILDNNYKYISNKLDKDYDTPKLIKEKEALINLLKNKNVKTTRVGVVISVFLGLSLLVLIFFYINQRLYKKRFKALLVENKELQKEKSVVKEKQQKLDISEETISHIIFCMEKFERQEKYLKTNLTLDKLSKSFKTNSKYLSLVLNQTKGKSVSQYINDLRIDYTVNELQRDLKFRKYTIKAIANEVGFNTDQAFSKAFYKKTGIYPSYFIKKLKEHNS